MKSILFFITFCMCYPLFAQMPALDVMANVKVTDMDLSESENPKILNEKTWDHKVHLIINDKMVKINDKIYTIVAIAKAKRTNVLGEYQIFYKDDTDAYGNFPFKIESFYYDHTYKILTQNLNTSNTTATYYDFSW